MRRPPPPDRRPLLRAALLPALLLSTSACTYRLLPPSAPQTLAIRIVTPNPQDLTLQVQDRSYPIAAGGITEFPFYSARRCRVVLFDQIPIGARDASTRAKSIEVRRAGTPIRRLSFRDLTHLHKDPEDRYLLPIPPQRR